jgi:hypothetical protein
MSGQLWKFSTPFDNAEYIIRFVGASWVVFDTYCFNFESMSIQEIEATLKLLPSLDGMRATYGSEKTSNTC